MLRGANLIGRRAEQRRIVARRGVAGGAVEPGGHPRRDGGIAVEADKPRIGKGGEQGGPMVPI